MEHFSDHCPTCHSNDGEGHTLFGKGRILGFTALGSEARELMGIVATRVASHPTGLGDPALINRAKHWLRTPSHGLRNLIRPLTGADWIDCIIGPVERRSKPARKLC
jgi:hypothetical protein